MEIKTKKQIIQKTDKGIKKRDAKQNKNKTENAIEKNKRKRDREEENGKLLPFPCNHTPCRCPDLTGVNKPVTLSFLVIEVIP